MLQTSESKGNISLKKQLKEKGISITLPNEILEKINFIIKGKEIVAKILEFFEPILTIPGEFGKGALIYIGSWNETHTVFLGKSSKGNDYILHFTGENGEKELQNFRSNFLDLAENAAIVEKINISSVGILYLLEPKDGMKTETEFEERLEETIAGQQQTLPKVSGERGRKITIGGKTSSHNIVVEYHASSAGKIQKILVTVNLRDASAKKFYVFVLESINASIHDLGAFSIISLLDKVTLTPILQFMKDCFSKNYQVGQVAMYAQSKQRKTTTHGKFVLKALKGIENKMKTKASYKEAQRHLVVWVERLLEKRSEYPDSHELFNQLRDILAKDSNYQPIQEQVKTKKTLAEVLELAGSDVSSDEDDFLDSDPESPIQSVEESAPQSRSSRKTTSGVSVQDDGQNKIYKVGNLEVSKEEYESLPPSEKPYDQMNPNEKGSYTNKMRNYILNKRRQKETVQESEKSSTEIVNPEDDEGSSDPWQSSGTISPLALLDDSLTLEQKKELELKQIIERNSKNDPALMALHAEYYKNKGPKPNKGWEPDYPITEREDTIIQGCLYADATLGLSASGSGRLRIAQGTKQKGYVIWKYMELRRLCTSNIPPTYREVQNYETGGLKKKKEL
uniref:Uncharacterized protein n=1 Tax=Pseudopediastrum integrum TaxID=271402 RepID=A0A2U8GKS6_9CHLO|nr:hypothetical protein [Pseudopediastrum integrum]YP_009492201.1 hypothetical protein [Pseudopediastrum integrum]AWI68779.1 hypothetical protein [Pseudopediastrum integrum]AWI68780.1 hypothetical protein [Pseudopediastrum integrum]